MTAASPQASVGRGAALALATQVVTGLFTAGLTIYLVRALGPGGYGVFALAVGLSVLIVLPADFGISQAAGRFIAERRHDSRAVAAVLVDALRLKLVITAVFAVALVALATPISNAYDSPGLADPLRVLSLALFGQSLMTFFGIALYALRRFGTNLALVASESAVEATSSVILVMLVGGATAASFGRAVGYVFGAALGTILLLRLLGLRSVKERRGGPAPRQMALYAGAMLIVDGAFAIFSQLGVVLVGAILGTAAAGIYAAPFRLTAVLHYPGVAAGNAVAPRMSRGPGEPPDTQSLVAALRVLMIVQAALTAVILVWAEPITDLLLGSEYRDSAGALRALTPFIFMLGVGPLLTLSINYFGEARRRIPIAVLSVLLHLVLGIALIEAMGIEGAAVSVDVAFAVYLLAHLRVCRELFGLPLGALGLTFVRGGLAAAALGGILAVAGEDVGAASASVALLIGGIAFTGVLLTTRETSVREIRGFAEVARASVFRGRLDP